MVTGHFGFPSRNVQMAMSGTQTASTAGVSIPGVLAIFKNWEGLQEPDGLFTVQLG